MFYYFRAPWHLFRLTCTASGKRQSARAELRRGVTGPACSAKSGGAPASLFSGQRSILQGACDSKADPLGYMLMFHTWASALHSERMLQTYLCFLLMTKQNKTEHTCTSQNKTEAQLDCFTDDQCYYRKCSWKTRAPAGVTQWVGLCPRHQEVTG